MSYNPHQVKAVLNAVFSNDPIITAFIGTNRVNGKDVKTRLTIKFFDASGKEVLPDKDSPFAYALSSLNSSLTNKGGHAEFVSDFGATMRSNTLMAHM